MDCSFYKLKNEAEISSQLYCFLDTFADLVNRTPLEMYAKKLNEFANNFILKCNGESIGLVSYYDNDITNQVGYIALIGLKSNYRAKGLGKKLLDFCCDNMRKSGMKSVRLEVRANNIDAIGFYLHSGFLHESYVFRGGVLQGYYMQKPL